MPKRSPSSLKKVTINLDAEDYAMIQEFYSATGAAVAIRQILQAHCLKMRQRLSRKAGTVVEIDIEGEEA